MNKKILVIILGLLFLSGCSTEEVFYQNNTLIENSKITENKDIENKEKIVTDGDIEEDINAAPLEEDEILTERAEEEHKTEEDTLIPQEEVIESQEEQGEGAGEDGSGNLDDEKIDKEQDVYTVIETFNTEVPKSIDLDIKYDKYPTSYNYLLVLSNNVNIREMPTTESKVLRKAFLYEKINLLEKVRGQYLEKYKSDIWYKVFWKNGEEIQYGYIYGLLAEPREFQFKKMEKAINKLKNEVDNNKTAYISNYKDRNGRAPKYNGQNEDKYGIKRYQSAPAYFEPNINSEFRYIQDGVLVSILGSQGNFYKIKTLNFQGEYWVPKKYVSTYNSIKELKKVIVVDRRNQNEGVFEYEDGRWKLISYVFATTGEKSQYKQETNLGYFMAIQTRDKFLYLDDVTREISGYAPYAIRFNGGAYIHGVPVEFDIVDGKRVDPGMKEYLFTIGTIPRSHKCVRNYTSHAKFLYDWIEIGKSAVIVIE